MGIVQGKFKFINGGSIKNVSHCFKQHSRFQLMQKSNKLIFSNSIDFLIDFKIFINDFF